MLTRKSPTPDTGSRIDDPPYRLCHVFINREWRMVFDEVREVTRWPLWAFNRIHEASRRPDGSFAASTPKGRAIIELRANAELGLLDHAFHVPNAPTRIVPCRVVPVGNGCLLTMTYTRPPDMPPHIFELDMGDIEEELQELKELLEESTALTR